MNKLMISLEKAYKVTFMNYENDTVEDNEGNYLDIGKEDVIILEHQIPFYQKFGGGIRELIYVGNVISESEIPEKTIINKNS